MAKRREASRSTSPAVGARAFWRVAALLVLSPVVLVAAYLFLGSKTSKPPIPQPANLSELEPDVRRLIEKQLVKVAEKPEDAIEYAELAQIYEANELWSEARDTYALAVSMSPKHSTWKLHLAIAAREKGDFDQYRTLLEELAAGETPLAAVHYRLGYLQLESSQLVEANKSFERALKLAPRDAEPYVGLADVRLRQNQIDAAIQLLQSAIKIDKSYRVPHFLLSRAYQRQGQAELAAQELKLGQQGKVRYLSDPLTPRIERYAATVRARHTLGMQQMMAGNAQAAVVLFEAAVRTDSTDASLLNSLAGAYMQLGRTEDAFRALQQALKADPASSTSYINLANWYLFSQRLEDALPMAQAAVERGPNVATAHRVLVETLLRLKRTDDARSAYERAIKQLPDEPVLRALQAQFDRLGSQ